MIIVSSRAINKSVCASGARSKLLNCAPLPPPSRIIHRIYILFFNSLLFNFVHLNVLRPGLVPTCPTTSEALTAVLVNVKIF